MEDKSYRSDFGIFAVFYKSEDLLPMDDYEIIETRYPSYACIYKLNGDNWEFQESVYVKNDEETFDVWKKAIMSSIKKEFNYS